MTSTHSDSTGGVAPRTATGPSDPETSTSVFVWNHQLRLGGPALLVRDVEGLADADGAAHAFDGGERDFAGLGGAALQDFVEVGGVFANA